MKLDWHPASQGFITDTFSDHGGWPKWVRELDGKSGVYFIRDKRTRKLLYIGESHTDRLKKTLLHHFQSWSGKTAGVTYSRAKVDIAAIVTKKSQAVDRQNRLICRMKPRDNGTAPGCETPEEENPF